MASAGDHDTVLVSNGLYLTTGELTIGAAFTVRGFNGREVTTVSRNDGFGNFRVFSVTDAGGLLEGLTIKDGYAENTSGGGVYLL